MKIPAAATNSTAGLKYDIDFYPLRGYARWEALLADPANNRPFPY